MSKITFIYAYQNEDWSTPLALAREFESRDWEVEFVSIGDNRSGKYNDIKLHEWITSDKETDIVLFLDWGRFDSKFLDKNRKDAFWVQESGDDPQNFERNFPKAERFHITLSPDADSTEEYKKRGIDAHWFTHFADTRVQFPIEDAETKFVAVTTRGQGGSQILDTITKHGKGAFGNQGGMNFKEHTEFLNSGLMVVQNSRWGEVTRRIFEGMACGKLVLTDRLKDSKRLQELFIEGQEIVFYDDIVDCINKMNHFTTHDKVREGIAKKGMKKVLENHTQVQRVDFIIEQYKKWNNIA
jgi:hypothetical protein